MAAFDPAVELTLQHEGGFFHNVVTGEVVNRGITLTFVRDCGFNPAADEEFIKHLTLGQTCGIYRQYFWDRYNIGAINDQALANKLFDLTVNMGPGGNTHQGALTLLQEAVNDCGGHCTIDGKIGPQSIAQINVSDPVQLLSAYRGTGAGALSGNRLGKLEPRWKPERLAHPAQRVRSPGTLLSE